MRWLLLLGFVVVTVFSITSQMFFTIEMDFAATVMLLVVRLAPIFLITQVTIQMLHVKVTWNITTPPPTSVCKSFPSQLHLLPFSQSVPLLY